MKCVILLLLATALTKAEFTTVGKARIYYEVSGSGAPAVVLVHGWTCDTTFWRFQQPDLAKRFRVVALDLPGHGKSDKPQIEYSADLFARAVLGVMKAAKVDRAVLAGHSMGVTVVRRTYDLEPSRVAGLVSVDGSVFRFESEGAAAKFREWVATMRGPGGVEVRRKMIEGMFRPSTTPALREEITRKMLAAPEHVAVSAMLNVVGSDVWSGSKVEVPVLALNKKAASERTEQLHREVFAKLDYREFPDVSHFLHMERPDKINPILIEFVREVGR